MTFDHPTSSYHQKSVREPTSKERLKRANDYLQSLKKSKSPGNMAKSSDFTHSSKHHQSHGKFSEVFNFTYLDNSRLRQSSTESNRKASMIKVEINDLMEKMDNASKSIFESYDVAAVKDMTENSKLIS